MQNEEIPEKIRTFILLNTFSLDSKECKKMSKYFLAHKNYLNNISFIELTKYKIHWGLQEIK
jgi:uncharacterized protein YpiB (UPF0302 family)